MITSLELTAPINWEQHPYLSIMTMRAVELQATSLGCYLLFAYLDKKCYGVDSMVCREVTEVRSRGLWKDRRPRREWGIQGTYVITSRWGKNHI